MTKILEFKLKEQPAPPPSILEMVILVQMDFIQSTTAALLTIMETLSLQKKTMDKLDKRLSRLEDKVIHTQDD
jgi:hypothetical protein